MVSNVLHMDRQELLDMLERIRTEYAEDPEYQELRRQFPGDWPI